MLQGLASILWDRALMLGDSAWLVVCVPIHPKGVWWGWGQGSVQASQVLTHRSRQNISIRTSLCTGALSCWNRKGPSPNCCHKVGSTEWSRMSLYAVALRFPFAVTKEPSPKHYSSSNKLYSWHYIQWGKKVFSQPPIVQVLPLKKMRGL